MAKKNRDLFEILGSRASSGAGRIAQRVQEIVSPPSSSAKKARKRGGKAQPNPVSGFVVAAVAFGCLVTGFAVGRWTGPSEVQDELNASNRREAPTTTERAGFGVEPGRFGGSAALSDEKLAESLSQFYYVLLPFPIPDGPQGEATAYENAARLARWAHGKGFE
ncbi:MAG: hypothetical protein KDB80_01825, partial [Planctomycetes bacterium]|nr:hypothetical protein [Planctomycetota bacterium]